MLAYLIASSVVFWIFALIWRSNDALNIITKSGLLFLAIMGTIFSLMQAGFVTKGM